MNLIVKLLASMGECIYELNWLSLRWGWTKRKWANGMTVWEHWRTGETRTNNIDK